MGAGRVHPSLQAREHARDLPELAEGVRRAPPPPRIALQHLLQDPREGGALLGERLEVWVVSYVEPQRHVLREFLVGLVWVVHPEGEEAGVDQLVEEDAQRPDVAVGAVAVFHRHLRRDVLPLGVEVVVVEAPGPPGGALDVPRVAEDLELRVAPARVHAVAREEHRVGGEVGVDVARPRHGLDALEHLDQDLDLDVQGHRLLRPVILRHQVRERLGSLRVVGAAEQNGLAPRRVLELCGGQHGGKVAAVEPQRRGDLVAPERGSLFRGRSDLVDRHALADAGELAPELDDVVPVALDELQPLE
mmetsp:Transcript_83861/g.234986  ORF Transcript_83861/g.234986 Transcript_83861/m.234986 type:complete len:304 (+) Transcript_83861:74-985(+)